MNKDFEELSNHILTENKNCHGEACCNVSEVLSGPPECSVDESQENNGDACNGTEIIMEKTGGSTDIHVKLGNSSTVYNLSRSLERVRCLINSVSLEDILSKVLPHQGYVTYIKEAQKTLKGNQKENKFKFVSSYPSNAIPRRSYNIRTGIPVIIIGDVTNIEEYQCSYVFICAYLNNSTTQRIQVARSLNLLNIGVSSADKSIDSCEDDSNTVDCSSNYSDSSSDVSSNSSSEEDEDKSNENSDKNIKKHEYFKPTVDVRNPLVFLEDGAEDKLPLIRECDVAVLKEGCIEIGYVMYIHELLVSVQGYKDSPALNMDTLLFQEDKENEKSLKSIGFVYEVIGPVEEPVYCVTFKEQQDMEKKEIKEGARVYISPNPEYTQFVFVQDLLRLKGSDASWKNDVEPPEQFIEYSDDEQERLAKQKLKRASSSESTSNISIKRKDPEENNSQNAKGIKRRAVQNSDGQMHSSVVSREDSIRSVPVPGPQQHQLFQNYHVPSRPPNFRPYHTPSGYQQTWSSTSIPSHSTEVNDETVIRSVRSPVPVPSNFFQHHRPPPGLQGIQPYQVPYNSQQMPHPAQVNGVIEQCPRMYPMVRRSPGLTIQPQVNGVARKSMASRSPGLAIQQVSGSGRQPLAPGPSVQQSTRMQQHGPVPAVNRQFYPVPPAMFPPNHHLPPP